MKQPWWKVFLSHFTDIHIESVYSDINPDLYVCLSKGRYQLCVKNAIYSFADKYDNYFDTFQEMDLSHFQGKEILVLGFGLGSIPYMLEKMGVQANYTGVEYDDLVIYLYNKYVASEIESPVEMISSDAFEFVMANQIKYDLIAMDVFVEDVIPDQFLEMRFIEKLRDTLTEEGVLIWNHLYHYEKDRREVDAFFAEKFKLIFEKGSFIQTSGNKMLLNKKIVPSSSKIK